MSTPSSATTPETKGAGDAPRPPAPAPGMKRSHAIALAAVVVLVVAALALPRRSAIVNAPVAESKPEAHNSTSQPTESAPVAPAEAESTPAHEVEPAATPVVQAAAPIPVVNQSNKKLPAKPTQKLATKTSSRPTMATPITDLRSTDASEREHEMAVLPVPAPTTPVPAIPSAEEVTITGCLEASGSKDRFRLTDTEGATAPKSRSWRTGFLKKRTASVDLVGARDVAAMQKQVGHRVAVSGVQTDRELTVASIHVVYSSCN